MQNHMLRFRRIRENPHHVRIPLTVMDHQCLAGVHGELNVPTKRFFLRGKVSGVLGVVADPIRIDACLPHRNTPSVRGHLREPFPCRVVELGGSRRMDRARCEHALMHVRGSKRLLCFREPIAHGAYPLHTGAQRTLHNRIDIRLRGGSGRGQVGVGVDKPWYRGCWYWCRARFLFAHTIEPLTFHAIDAQTQTSIDNALAEAAAKGLNGPARVIIERFEGLLEDFLALPRDAQRSYPRGDTARIVGTALGDAFVRDYGFTWKLLKDDYGTDLVVVRDADTNSPKYTAPIMVVDARFDDDATGKLTTFLEQFLSGLQH